MEFKSNLIKKTLRNDFTYWLRYEDITYYMKFCKKKFNKKDFSFEITSNDNTNITFKKGIKDSIVDFLNDTDINFFILFISTNNEHWFNIIFIKKNNDLNILLFDSLYDKEYNVDSMMKFFNKTTNRKIIYKKIQPCIQNDGYNCGIFCILFTTIILQLTIFDENDDLLYKKIYSIMKDEYDDEFLIKVRIRISRYILNTIYNELKKDKSQN